MKRNQHIFYGLSVLILSQMAYADPQYQMGLYYFGAMDSLTVRSDGQIDVDPKKWNISRDTPGLGGQRKVYSKIVSNNGFYVDLPETLTVYSAKEGQPPNAMTLIVSGKGSSVADLAFKNGKISAVTRCESVMGDGKRCYTATPKTCEFILKSTQSKDFNEVLNKISACEKIANLGLASQNGMPPGFEKELEEAVRNSRLRIDSELHGVNWTGVKELGSVTKALGELALGKDPSYFDKDQKSQANLFGARDIETYFKDMLTSPIRYKAIAQLCKGSPFASQQAVFTADPKINGTFDGFNHDPIKVNSAK